MLVCILLCEGNVEIASNVLDIEWCIAWRQAIVIKVFFHQIHMMKVGVIDLYTAIMKIRHIEEAGRTGLRAIRYRHRGALEDGLSFCIHFDDGIGWINLGIPT